MTVLPRIPNSFYNIYFYFSELKSCDIYKQTELGEDGKNYEYFLVIG